MIEIIGQETIFIILLIQLVTFGIATFFIITN